MFKAHSLIAGALALACHIPSMAAEVAGKVLFLQGTAEIERSAQKIPLARGSTVESGDLIRVGKESALQLRMTDESLIALRANTEFNIENYQFSEQGSDKDRSVYGLVKGGMRTVTGLIGKRNPSAYEMKANTATIGIRGTIYAAIKCADDCFNDDGSLAPNGLYGIVYDGRIVVGNKAGFEDFLRDQYFFVLSDGSLPQRLLSPPSFLRERLFNLLARNSQSGRSLGAQAQATSSSGDVPPPPSTTGAGGNDPLIVGMQTTGGNNATPAENFPVAQLGENTTFSPANAPSASASATLLSAEYNPSSGNHNSFNSADFSTDSSGLVVDDKGIVSVGGYYRNNATSNEAGADAGVIAWDRWAGGTATLWGWGDQALANNQGFHIIYGTTPTAAPTSDNVAFNYIGGTRPTETTNLASGNVWSVTGGQLTVNFNTANYNGYLNFNLTSTAGPSSYTMNFASNYLDPYSVNSWKGAVTHSSGTQNVCGSACAASGSLIFAGAGATHAGISYEFGQTNGVYVQGVAAFKR